MYIKYAIIIGSLWNLMGCGGGPCTAGQSEACVCLNGQQGTQLCLEDLTLAECRCDNQGNKTEPFTIGEKAAGGTKDSGTSLHADSRLASGQKKIFVTSTVYGGNLLSYVPGALSGLAAADALCQQVAAGAMLGGSWIAWLSAANDFTAPIHAIDRVQDVGPWYLLTGEKAFNNKANLTGTPLMMLNVDERGQEIWAHSEYERIWTGSKTGGTLSGIYNGSCEGWMSTYGSGMTGDVMKSDTTWSTHSTDSCDSSNHLLCLQQ